MRRYRLGILAVGGILIGIGLGLLLVPGALQRILPKGGITTIGQATIGGPFTLTDHNGKRTSDTDFRGRFMLIYFGFTHCPDVCPSALQVMSAALDKVGDKARRVTPILISVDAERDTPEQLKSYVASFHTSMVGLSGSVADIAAAAKAYRVYFAKVNDPKSAAGYTIDHSSIIYLMGTDGRFVTHFTHATSVDAMASVLAKHL